MKKITMNVLVVMFMLGSFVGVAQTLNQPANWPNAAWTLSGTYNAVGLLSDPTGAGATFTFDDDAAGNGNVDMVMVTSPVIDLTAASGAGETWISVSGNFTYYALGGDVLAVEVYDADAMTWSQLYQFAGNTTTVADYQGCVTSEAYTTPVLDISGFTATQLSGFQYRVSYNDAGGWQYGYCVESPTIMSETPPSCIDPSMLTATSITDTSANLGWMENGTATVWNVEVVANGSPATGTPTASGVANPYAASGLTAETAYDFYVQADCGGAGTSNWVGPFTFTTACAPIAAAYMEDFETFTVSAAAFSGENCWSGSNTGASFYWESAAGTDTSSGGTGPSPTITTGNYFFTEASGAGIGDVAELVSPLVDLTALTAPALTFDYHMFGGQIGTLEVVVNGTVSVWSLSGQQQATETTPWELAVVDLAAYAGQTITVTLRATSAGTFEGDIAVDNVSFTELPSCPTPNALNASNITDTMADLGWTENGTATAWDIEIVDVTGGGTATGTPTASGVTNPYTAMGLTENNDYEFYVRADCGGDLSTWAGPFSFTTLETCPTPSALTVSNLTTTSADLGWTENGTSTLWNIEIVDVTAGGTATGTPTVTGVTTNPYTASGLAVFNSYEFYVQADCGGSGVSAWAGPFSFTTLALPPSNDDCANAMTITPGGTFNDSPITGQTNAGATDSGELPLPGCAQYDPADASGNGGDVWYSVTVPSDGNLTIETDSDPTGNGGDGGMAVYTGSCGSLVLFECDDDDGNGLYGQVIIDPADGLADQVVYVRVWEYGGNAIINFQVSAFSATLSTGSFEDEAAFTFYPNPVKNTLRLNAQNTIENVTMYNMLGQEVLRATPNAVNSELDMSNLQDGTYFVKVTIANITKTVRVVKN